jgi:hypothetical protein
MSALAFEIRPVLPAGRVLPHGLQLAVAAVAGALAPWLLLVTAYGGLARSAASCLGSPLPI